MFAVFLCDRVSRREHGDPQIEELNIGEAAEPEGRGTGESLGNSTSRPLGGAKAPRQNFSLSFLQALKQWQRST